MQEAHTVTPVEQVRHGKVQALQAFVPSKKYPSIQDEHIVTPVEQVRHGEVQALQAFVPSK
jgi:hypothetical protein